MTSMHLQSAGATGEVDRYIGYYQPYATSHQELDRDMSFQAETRNAAKTLAEAIVAKRAGRLAEAGTRLPDPRSK
jgi:multimeric flavodoxin WrbA